MINRMVLKFELDLEKLENCEPFMLRMSDKSEVLSIRNTRGKVSVYVYSKESFKEVSRVFVLVPPGLPFNVPNNHPIVECIGSVVVNDNGYDNVLHLFELCKKSKIIKSVDND